MGRFSRNCPKGNDRGKGVQAIEILKPGAYTDAKGQKVAFTAADLAGIAAAYDPALSEAPLVVGHPKTDDPAYGWVKTLKLEGERLVAEPHQVDAAFADLVAAGRFKKVSASLFRPDAANSPKKGGWYLRHIGFLGAQAPAVKGLKSVQLSEADAGVVELATWADSTIARAFRALRDFLIGEFGQEKADRALPPWTVDSMQEETAAERAKAAPASFSDPPAPAPVNKESEVSKELEAREAAAKAAEDKNAKDRADLDKQAADLAEREAKARREDDEELLDELVEAGRLAPGHKNGLLDFMGSLEEGETLEFAEAGGGADGKTKTKATQRAWFRGFLGKLPKVVDFGEAAPGGPGAVDLADPGKIAEAAIALQTAEKAKGIDISVADAVLRVSKK